MSLSDHTTESPKHRPGSSASFTGRRWITEMAVLVLSALLIVFAVKLWIVEPLVVTATSMYPTLQEGERIVVDKLAYTSDGPEVGDIVVLIDPEGGGRRLVKRVVASGGQRLGNVDGILAIDAQQTEMAVAPDLPGPNLEYLNYPLELSSDELFVVGDNSAHSRDSRAFGPVRRTAVIGRVTAVYWPPESARTIERTSWSD